MKRRIKRVGPLQAGKMLGVFYAALGLLFVPFFAVAAIFGAFAEHAAQGRSGSVAIAGGLFLVMSLMFPIFYGAMVSFLESLPPRSTTWSLGGSAAWKWKWNDLTCRSFSAGECYSSRQAERLPCTGCIATHRIVGRLCQTPA